MTRRLAHTTVDLIERMAFDHPGAQIERHGDAVFLSLRGITWKALLPEVTR